MSFYRLAEALHKFVWEVKEIPASEYDGWKEYFQIQHREQEKQRMAQRSSGKGRSGSTRTLG